MLKKRAHYPEADEPQGSLSAISRSCFVAMQSKKSLALTLPYHTEEREQIESALESIAPATGHSPENFIAIGCAQMRYADIALKNCQTYTAIEPSLAEGFPAIKIDYWKKLRGMHILPKNFENVTEADLPEKGPRVFFFLFNVFPYIDNALDTLKKLARRGDLVVISGWNNDNEKARKLQSDYYSYLQSAFGCSVSHKGSSAYLDTLEEEGKTIASASTRVKGHTTDILTMRIK